MEPDAPVEGDQIAIDVIEDLDSGSWFCQENGEASGEWFHIADVIWDVWKDVFEEPGFAARPGDCRFYCVADVFELDGALCAVVLRMDRRPRARCMCASTRAWPSFW